MLQVKFRPGDVLADCPEALNKLTLWAQFTIGLQAQVQANATASKWADVASLVLEQDMDATYDSGELACEEFSELMEEIKKTDPVKGISIRWMVAVAPDSTAVELQLQALPVTGAGIKANPALMEDTAATIILDRQPLVYTAFNTKYSDGPVPIMFSNNPEETAQIIKEQPEAAHRACQLLYSRLLRTQALTQQQAAEYVKQPRPGVYTTPLVDQGRERAASMPPEPKKAKTLPAEMLTPDNGMEGIKSKLNKIKLDMQNVL
jgi:hypothetical protein